MNENQLEEFGAIIDQLDNIAHALSIPMDATIHVESLKELIPEKVNKLKELYKEVTGENPWDMWEEIHEM